jgi:chemotaxis protein MotB
MALRRKRDSSMIWPGFVDAVTTLLMVLMFVLTIFTVMQSVLRETISSQTTELDSLAEQVASLADALGLERAKVGDLQGQVGSLTSDLSKARAKGEEQAALIATLTGQIAAKQSELTQAQGRITSFEAQVAALLSERDDARGLVVDLKAANAKALSEKDAMDLALAKARTEVDKTAEEARLAAAKRDALQALLVELQAKSAAAQVKISEVEAGRLVDAAALNTLREKLKSSDAELISMTLALEEARKKAEETLTLLAAAQTNAAKTAMAGDQKAALLAVAEAALTAEQAKSQDSARMAEVLNQQIAALRAQLGELQGMLDASAAKDSTNKVQIDALGSKLNAALAQVASEQKKRAELEEIERKRLQAVNADLEKFRSEFFGQLSQLLAGKPGVRVVGDRFVFSSEVLFTAGSADLAPEGQAQIADVVKILDEVAGKIPPSIDWIIRVDGHTDDVPLSGEGAFKDNWQLSQARALSVVRYMQDGLGFPPQRLAATGFGEYQPVASGGSFEDRAQNRRIELKLTER